MRLGKQYSPSSKSPQVLGMIVDHNIPLNTIFTSTEYHLFPSNKGEKQQIASKVIPLFRSGDVLLIDGGTSNLEVARRLPTDMELTVYTNSFPIVNALFNHPKLDLIFLGGKVFPSSQVTVGVSVFQALQTVRPDWLVLGICSVHPHQGLTGPDREEALIKRFMMERAQKRIVLADSHKLNTAEAYSIASLGDVDYLVTEDQKIDYIRQHWPKHSYVLM